MAAWQFDLYLVPSSVIERTLGQSIERLSSEQFEAIAWWAGEQKSPAAVAEKISSILPQRKSWAVDMLIWGDEDGNCVLLLYHDASVVEVRVRIDVRRLDWIFVDLMANLAKYLDCKVITEEYEVVVATPEAIAKESLNSRARRFIVDPKAFLGDTEVL
jgi:hypothetical protein